MTVCIDGLDISYISEGEGTPLLIVHGWGCEGEVYRGIIDFLSPFYKVVVPDLPGFGKSEEPVVPYSVGDYVKFIKDFCVELGLNEVIILGHSLGGRIVIKALSGGDFPIKVNRVILTGAAGKKPKKSLKAKAKTRIYKVGKAILSLSLMTKLFPNALENYRSKNGSADYLAASSIMRQTLVKIVNEDLKPLLPDVKAEVLLVWGENDDAAPLSDGKIMEQMMPNAGLAVIPNAGHYAFLDKKTQFNNILKSYLL